MKLPAHSWKGDGFNCQLEGKQQMFGHNRPVNTGESLRAFQDFMRTRLFSNPETLGGGKETNMVTFIGEVDIVIPILEMKKSIFREVK